MKAPSVKLPRLAIPAAGLCESMDLEPDRHPATYSARGVKMAKYKMHYDCSKAVRELRPAPNAGRGRAGKGGAVVSRARLHNRMLKRPLLRSRRLGKILNVCPLRVRLQS